METTQRASNWSITINNPQEDDRESLKQHPSFVKKVVYQDEVGENQTLHIQGYVETAQIRFSQMKKWLPRAHIEIARNKQALLSYVQKKDTAVDGTQVTQVAEYVSMDQALRNIAGVCESVYKLDGERLFNMDEGRRQKEYKNEFWSAVSRLLYDSPKLVGLYTNPQLERAWVNTRGVWLKLNSEAKVYNAKEDEVEHEASGTQDASPPSTPSSSDTGGSKSETDATVG